MFLHIAIKDLKVVFKDRKALAVMLLMPILIILILGTALGNVMSAQLAISKFSVAVVNHDDGFISKMLIDDVFKKGMSDMFTTEVVSMEEAEKRLKSKEYPAAVIIPENFTKDFNEGKKVELEVRSSEGNLKSAMVRSVVISFADRYSQTGVGIHEAYGVLAKKAPELAMDPLVIGELQQKLGGELLGFNEKVQEQTKYVSGMQYYAAAMLIMFVLFGVNIGIKELLEEKEMRTLGRISCALPGRVSIMTGKFLGLMFICLLQAAILILFTHFFYKVNWGDSLPGAILVTVCTVFAGAGLGMMIAAISKTAKMADGLSSIFIQLFTMISGGMVPIYIMPDQIKIAAKFTLNWWASQGYYNLMTGLGIWSVLPACGILLAMGVAFLSVGILRFRLN